jgi:hypothetical protein
MFSARPLSGSGSRYCMGFQGQGKVVNGECEALGIIDSFTRVAGGIGDSTIRKFSV